MATAALTRTRPALGRSPIVLWHLLSLDAPCVAAVWTAFLVNGFGLAEPLAVPFALGLAVWLLYAADRIRDASRGEIGEERHQFHLLHRKGFITVGAAATVLLVILLTYLPSAVREGWLVLAAPLCVYAVAIHVLQLRLSKEPLVAILFAAAVAMPLAVHRSFMGGTALLPVMIAFGCLCWLNCIAIARWEHSLLHADACTAWLGRHFTVAAALTACVALPLLTSRVTTEVGLATLCATLCLLLLENSRRHLTRTTLRALADAALLTPVVLWPLLAVLGYR